MWDLLNSLFGWLLPAAKPSLPAPPPPLSWWQCPVPDQVTKELARVEKVLDQVQQTPSWGAPVPRQRRTAAHFPVSTEWELFKPGKAYRTSSSEGFLLAKKSSPEVPILAPLRVSPENPRQDPNHWLYEVGTSRWFWHRSRPYKYQGRRRAFTKLPGTYQVAEELVPDDVKDRAFMAYLKEKS
jgi:hypothetical protein